MYTIPASSSNYDYDGNHGSRAAMRDSDSISPIRRSRADKYVGDPLRDLAREDSDKVAPDNDLQNFFDEQLPKRGFDEGERPRPSQEDMKTQINKILEQERQIEAQRAEELRLSINLERLKIEQSSKAEIKAKQEELDEIQQRLSVKSSALVTLQAELEDMKKQQAKFEEIKEKARAYMLQQQRENQQLREEYAKLMREKEQL